MIGFPVLPNTLWSDFCGPRETRKHVVSAASGFSQYKLYKNIFCSFLKKKIKYLIIQSFVVQGTGLQQQSINICLCSQAESGQGFL